MADEQATNLSDKERDMAQRLAENPMDLFQGKSIGWLEDFIRITVGNTAGLSGRWITGDVKIISQDLTAQTGVYEYEDESGQWLYQNGAAASQTTYADLYAFYGANKFAADSGGNFTLADTRGRVMALCGTHTDAGLGDNDGVAVASRTMKHSHTNGATITGAPGVGSLAISPNPHNHRGTDSAAGAGTNVGATVSVNATTGDTNLSITGAPDAGTLAVGGTIGTGTPVDTPAHIFIGSALVRI